MNPKPIQSGRLSTDGVTCTITACAKKNGRQFLAYQLKMLSSVQRGSGIL